MSNNQLLWIASMLFYISACICSALCGPLYAKRERNHTAIITVILIICALYSGGQP